MVKAMIIIMNIENLMERTVLKLQSRSVFRNKNVLYLDNHFGKQILILLKVSVQKQEMRLELEIKYFENSWI